MFDESHAMANAAGGKSRARRPGAVAAGPRGPAPAARAARMRASSMSRRPARPRCTISPMPSGSASGAARIFRSPRAPSSSQAIEAGGVAAMEVLARDLKALGLYAARSLSYEGVEYELVEHTLTPEQIRIYDAYAGAFQVIHNNLDAAMQAANVTGETRHAERPGQVRRALGLRMRQAALLQSPDHRDEDADADRRDRARSRRRPCRRHPDRLDRRGADGAAARRDSDRGMGRRRRSTSRRANTSSTIWRTASRPSSSSRSPTARAISPRGRSIATASRCNAARPSNGATA